jgi:Glycogen recognition site of AMP-activated protein kinase
MKNEKDFSDIISSKETDLSREDSQHRDEEEELLFLARMLRDMPDREPPRDLAEAILRSVKPKQVSVWRRLYLWAATPRSITLYPVKLVPAAAVAIVLALFLTINFFPRHKSPLDVNRGKQELVSVTFTFHYPQARSVSLIGSFNQWKPGGLAMRSAAEKSVWVLELQLPEGRHEYAFLVDGRVVVADPNSRFSQDDGFGNKNSILFATRADEQHI